MLSYNKPSLLNVCRCCFTEKFLSRRGLSTTQNLSRTNLPHQKILTHFRHAQKNAAFLSQLIYCPTACGGTRGLFGGSRDNVHQQTLEDIAENIKESKFKRVVVMAGAGISTPSGIPDFRSPGSGLYDNLQQYNLPYAEAIFEINYFRHNPNPFFALAKELYPGNYQPNLTHYFIRLLHDKGQLLRMYTQNIDGLERMAGIPPHMLVEAHGTFATATCTVCRRDYKGEELRNDIMEGKIPKCSTCKGVIKPDIVFFGEELPRPFFSYLRDFPIADLLIVMGTSLEVEPFASLAGAVRGSVSRLLINRDLVGPFSWGSRHTDVAELGDVVSGVKKLVELLGWKQELETLMNAGGDEASTNKE
ncbi:NAD-dependent protein deacetylase sirtuin-3, mitochondrial isoform X1 [Rhinichthys klamathensis goyatoka]|uniref:NAD-dependent protein deacetylase sirtuin-3, mitochondrial isoform X1 n=1 Tax=Rhinichthys klamathensis goyatoka TaxID=3034132 RepID=UPI0024B5EA0E|nr:NAD-dependent protein deacetylase sirtuin-3, mitochondrial isoform X1 [Rhinichthys klamathensis goyatoka]